MRNGKKPNYAPRLDDHITSRSHGSRIAPSPDLKLLYWKSVGQAADIYTKGFDNTVCWEGAGFNIAAIAKAKFDIREMHGHVNSDDSDTTTIPCDSDSKIGFRLYSNGAHRDVAREMEKIDAGTAEVRHAEPQPYRYGLLGAELGYSQPTTAQAEVAGTALATEPKVTSRDLVVKDWRCIEIIHPPGVALHHVMVESAQTPILGRGRRGERATDV